MCRWQVEPSILISIVLVYASHVCSQHSFGLPLTMNADAQKAIWSRAFGPSITRNLITCVLTICHMKFAQSTALDQKSFDLRSFEPLVITSLRINPRLSIRKKSRIYAFQLGKWQAHWQLRPQYILKRIYFLNMPWIRNRVDTKSGFNIVLSGDVTRSSPVLDREYCI